MNANHAINARENISKSDTDFLRLAIGRTRQIHYAAHRLNHEIITGTLGIRTVLTKARDRAIDKARINGFQAFIIEAIFFQSADFEILDQHIGMACEFADYRLAFSRFKINRNRALATIARVEIGSRQITAIGCFHKRRPPGARVIPCTGPLDFNNIGAEIGQRLPDPRPRENTREF